MQTSDGSIKTSRTREVEEKEEEENGIVGTAGKERAVNHFANHSELTRKDLLKKNLQRASRMA